MAHLSCSECIRFETRDCYRLQSEIFVIFSLSRRIRREFLDMGFDHFLSGPFLFTIYDTERIGSSGNASDLYAEGASFESWSGHRLSGLRFLVVSSVTRLDVGTMPYIRRRLLRRVVQFSIQTFEVIPTVLLNILQTNKKFWEGLSLKRHGLHRKWRVQRFFCYLCICCRGNVFTEPSNDRGYTYRHTD
jgi:hypothetical protein